MRLASAESVPVRPSREAEAILRWLDRLAGARAGLDLERLESLRRELRSLAESAASLEALVDAALAEGGPAVARAAEGGDRLLACLKAFVDDSDPQFYRHPIYGWDIHALYGGDTLPGLGRALREGRAEAISSRAAAARSRSRSGRGRRWALVWTAYDGACFPSAPDDGRRHPVRTVTLLPSSPMKQRSDVLSVSTRRGLVEITTPVREVVRAAGVREGLCTVFVRHTSASLVIQENADPSVQRDLEAFLIPPRPRRRRALHPRCRGTRRHALPRQSGAAQDF